MAKKFTGTDRRLLTRLSDALRFLKGRDDKARDPKPTSAISTRDVVVDQSNPNIEEAFSLVEQRVTDCLDCEKGVVLPGFEMEAGKYNALVGGALDYLPSIRSDQVRADVSITPVDVTSYGCSFELTDTGPAPQRAPIRLSYTWEALTVTGQTLVSRCDQLFGASVTDLWLDRTA